MLDLKTAIGRSPLTDPRSLAFSLLVHAALIVVASTAALSVVIPRAPELPQALEAELDSVDNRDPASMGAGGGGAGELGGMEETPMVPTAGGESSQGGARDPSADALLAEILPVPVPADALPRALPGPQIRGVGVVPGPGLGGGGGAGGGSGGGVGRGVGPGTEFFGARENAGSFAYVIDCSGSMGTRNSLEIAKRELVASLDQLPPDANFGVVFYNQSATIFSDPQGRKGLMSATTANKARVHTQLAGIAPFGGTDHMLALRAALALHPEVIFFLTDADQMIDEDATAIIAEAGSTRIHCIVFGRGTDLGESAPIRKLAAATGGLYRYIDVLKFPRPPAR
jgi:hypothetical protein